MRRRARFQVITGLVVISVLGPARLWARDSRPSKSVQSIEARVARAEHLFEIWDFQAAIHEAEALYTEYPGLPPVQRLAGIAKFHQQDYEGAIALLTRAGAGRPEDAPPDPYLERARATREITRDYATYESEHFALRVPKGVDEILPAYALPALEAAYQAIGDDFDFHPGGRLTVEAYEQTRDLAAASGLTPEAIKTSGTIAICKYDKLMFTSPKALLRGYAWLDTLSHEYVHFVVSSISANTVPIWLHEGIAKYEETRWNGAAGRALTPYSETLLYEAVAGKRRFITFEEMSPSMALLPSQEATALAFAEVFSLVEYLVSARGGYPNLRRLIAALKEGTPERQAIRSVYGQSFDRLQRAWKAWLEERPRKAHGRAIAEHLTFREDVKGKDAQTTEDEGDPSGDLKNADARRFAHLGELLRLEGRPKAAVVEYEKAYALTGPEAVHLANKLARTYLGLGRAKEAESLLLQVRDVAPSLVTTHINLGRAYLLEERPEAALAAYRKAAEQNPFDPEIHAALAKIYQARGDEARARREAQALALTSSHIEAIRRQRRTPKVADAEMGQLSIHTTPWAKVRIDGEDDGLTTPVFRYPLPPGEHTVTLRTAGGVTRSVPVTIEKAKEARIVLDLDASEHEPAPAP